MDQFLSGILPNDTLCKPNLTLIIKSEDGSPACVKPDTANALVERGWAKPITGGISNSQTSNQTAFSSSNCLGKEVSKNQNSSLVVLLMNPNSTATVCTIYQFDRNWGGGILHFGFDVGPKLNVTAIPNVLDITNASAGDNFTVLYKISANPDSKGIYSYSIPWDICEQYPLAVGYTASDLKKSDFSLEVLLGRTCPNYGFHVASDKILSGMNYTEVVTNGH